MKTPMGLRGAICERFGWTLDYLEHKIPWLKVHYMMVDAPRLEFETDGNKGKKDAKNENNAPKTKDEKLLDYLNGFNKT